MIMSFLWGKRLVAIGPFTQYEKQDGFGKDDYRAPLRAFLWKAFLVATPWTGLSLVGIILSTVVFGWSTESTTALMAGTFAFCYSTCYAAALVGVSRQKKRIAAEMGTPKGEPPPPNKPPLSAG